MRRAPLALLLALWASVGVAETQASPAGLDGFVTLDLLTVPPVARLQDGRAIWGDSCQNCHGGNTATGAPKITSITAWEARISQGLPVLIDHALNGFIGPRYTQMPARGANPDLTDRQVALAVAYMVWASGGAEQALQFILDMKETEQ